MRALTELEKEILALSSAERERLATVAWDSLVDDPQASGNREIDPEAIQLATQRDGEIASGKIQPIDHAEFLRRTGGSSE